MQHMLPKCFQRPRPEVKQLPMGVIVEIGRTLDVETRRNLMLANKLMMNAFTDEDREEITAEYASYMLAKTWKTLFETAVKTKYSLYFRFEQKRNHVDIEIRSDVITITVNKNKRAALQKALPQAEMRTGMMGYNKWYIYLHITGKDSTVIDAISRLTSGMKMLSPSAHQWSSSIFAWRRYSRANKTLVLKPIFDKLLNYHAETVRRP